MIARWSQLKKVRRLFFVFGSKKRTRQPKNGEAEIGRGKNTSTQPFGGWGAPCKQTNSQIKTQFYYGLSCQMYSDAMRDDGLSLC